MAVFDGICTSGRTSSSTPATWPTGAQVAVHRGGRADNRVVFAGLAVANSGTGRRACTVTPWLVAQACANGMTITRDAVHAVASAAQLQDGGDRHSRAGAADPSRADGPVRRHAGDERHPLDASQRNQ